MHFLWAFLLVCVLLAGWVLTLLGMPGNWLMVAAVAGYALLVPEPSPLGISWMAPVVMLVLAAVGELMEFLAGALGVAKVGGSRRGAVLALAGSIAGGIIGLFVGLPIPVIGPMVSTVLFAGVGALLGALFGETWKGRAFDESWKVGKAAFWGRLLGTAAKTIIGAVMIAAALIALFI